MSWLIWILVALVVLFALFYADIYFLGPGASYLTWLPGSSSLYDGANVGVGTSN